MGFLYLREGSEPPQPCNGFSGWASPPHCGIIIITLTTIIISFWVNLLQQVQPSISANVWHSMEIHVYMYNVHVAVLKLELTMLVLKKYHRAENVCLVFKHQSDIWLWTWASGFLRHLSFDLHPNCKKTSTNWKDHLFKILVNCIPSYRAAHRFIKFSNICQVFVWRMISLLSLIPFIEDLRFALSCFVTSCRLCHQH